MRLIKTIRTEQSGSVASFANPVQRASKLRRHALLLACCLAVGPVAAESGPDLTSLPVEALLDMQVYSASLFPQRVSEAPSAVTIITAADIRDYGYRTLADILRSIRGLYVTEDRNYSYLGVNGFGRPGDYNSRVAVLVDGYKTNDNVYDMGFIGTEFILDVDLIDRVEFVPGPGSSLYGANALFGVVNVITRRGRDLDGFETSALAGSFRTRKAQLNFGRQLGSDGDLLLSATYYEKRGEDLFFPEFDSPATNNGFARGLDGDRSAKLLAKLQHGGWGLEAAYSTRTKSIPTASYGTVFGDPGTRTVDQQAFVNATYYRPLADAVDFSGRLYYGRYDYDGDYRFDEPPLITNKDGSRGRWWGGELKLLATRIEGHKLVLGADYQQDLRRDQFNYDPDPNVPILDDHRSGNRYGVYAQDEWTFRDGWLLNAGGRYDRPSGFDGVVSPRVALIHQPSQATSIKLVYGTAFRTPNAYELYYHDSGPAATQKTNPDLRSEKIKTLQFVVEQRIASGLRLTASAFHYRINNLIDLTTDPADGLLVFENVASAHSNGVQLEAERIWRDGGRLRASYSYQKTRDGATGELLTNSPSSLAKLNAVWPLFSGRLRTGFEVQYVGSRKTLASTVPAYTVANLTFAAPQVLPGLDLGLSAYNLLDRVYYDPGGPEHVQDRLPQSRRSFEFKVTYRF